MDRIVKRRDVTNLEDFVVEESNEIEVNNNELIDNVDESFLKGYYNLIKIKREYNLYKQEDFNKFKDKIINTFKKPTIFLQKESETIQKVYVQKIEKCTDIKMLCKTLLNLYTVGGYRREILLYYIVNSNLKIYHEENIKSLKYILIGILLNFSKEINTSIKNIKKVFRLTNFEEGVLEADKFFFCNQFLSTSVYDNLSGDNDFFKGRNTVLEIKLNFNEDLDFFSNYIDISDESDFKKEQEVLICHFTKFELYELNEDDNKRTANLRIINNNIFITSIFSNLFRVSTDSNVNSHYEKLMVFYENSLNLAIKNGDKTNEIEMNNQLGNLNFLLTKNDKALQYFEHCLELRKEKYGENNIESAGSYNNLGLVYTERLEYEKAFQNFLLSLKILEHLAEAKKVTIAKIYNNMGYVFLKQCNYSSSREYFLKDIEIMKTLKGRNYLSLLDSYNNLGLSYYEEKNYDLAEQYYLKANEICKKHKLETHVSSAGCFNNMGNLYSQKKDYEKALEYYKKSVNIRIKALGENQKEVALSFNNIGLVYIEQGSYSKAIEYFQKSLNILDPKSIENALFLDNMGKVYILDRKYQKAKEYYEKALNLRKLLIEEGSKYFPIGSYNGLGEACFLLGEYDNALEYFNKSIHLSKSLLGSHTLQVANCYLKIGFIHFFRKNYPLCIENFEKVLEIKSNKYGQESAEVGEIYTNIGQVHLESNNIELASQFFEKSLKCDCKTNFTVYKNLADLKMKKNLPEIAIQHYNSAAKILETIQNNKDILSSIYQKMASIKQQNNEIYECIEILEKAKGELIDHYDGEKDVKIADIYKELALNHEKIGSIGEAITSMESCINIKTELKGIKYQGLPEDKEKLNSLKLLKKRKNECACCIVF